MAKGFSEFRSQMDTQSPAPVEETVGLDYVHAVEDADVDVEMLEKQESERKEAFAQRVWENLEEMRANGSMDVGVIEEALDTAAELGLQEVNLLYALRNLRNENPAIRVLGYVELARRKARRSERSYFDQMAKSLSEAAHGFEFPRLRDGEPTYEREMLERYAEGGQEAFVDNDAAFIPVFQAMEEAGVDMRALLDQVSPEGGAKTSPDVVLELENGVPVLSDVEILKAIRYAPMFEKGLDRVRIGTEDRMLISLNIQNERDYGMIRFDGRPNELPSSEVLARAIGELLKTGVPLEGGVVPTLYEQDAMLIFDGGDGFRSNGRGSGWGILLEGKVGQYGEAIIVRLNSRDS